ncbi:MAG TPA: alpha/beta hydrolase, partial [Saprospiraceae bacterium]|nr:alpha/beta hydrolase [Saprospiraceae bacterium]
MNKHLYLISGLGADERIFQRIDFQGFTTHHLHWIAPEAGESLRDYAERMRSQITTENPRLLGVSFGGMIATEISRQMACEGLILVSTATTRNEIPLLYRLAGKLHLHKLLPNIMLKRANVITYWLFGMKTTEEKQLLASILADTDSTFLSWAINALLCWDNHEPANSTLRLHGGKDHILPAGNIKTSAMLIPDGGHLMVFTHADEVRVCLKNIHRAENASFETCLSRLFRAISPIIPRKRALSQDPKSAIFI